MINKIFTVSTTDLNAHTAKILDTMISVADAFPTQNMTTKYMFPKRIQFINRTGQDVTVNIFSSSDEFAKYTASATLYAFFTIPSGTVYNMGTSENLPHAYKVGVLMPSGSASVDFQFECIGYQPLI